MSYLKWLNKANIIEKDPPWWTPRSRLLKVGDNTFWDRVEEFILNAMCYTAMSALLALVLWAFWKPIFCDIWGKL